MEEAALVSGSTPQPLEHNRMPSLPPSVLLSLEDTFAHFKVRSSPKADLVSPVKFTAGVGIALLVITVASALFGTAFHAATGSMSPMLAFLAKPLAAGLLGFNMPLTLAVGVVVLIIALAMTLVATAVCSILYTIPYKYISYEEARLEKKAEQQHHIDTEEAFRPLQKLFVVNELGTVTVSLRGSSIFTTWKKEKVTLAAAAGTTVREVCAEFARLCNIDTTQNPYHLIVLGPRGLTLDETAPASEIRRIHIRTPSQLSQKPSESDINHSYAVLGLEATASDDEIKQGYKAKARLYHPDKNPAYADQFYEVQTAYEILTSRPTPPLEG